ncbi:MAG: tetratricopeptide repeat protein [Ignavibacteriales bacterium]|nr:tetratricopeptide repeat protein [Ignavibacteriales bacterium]
MDLLEFDIDFLAQKLSSNASSPIFARLADLYLAKGQVDDALKICTDGVAEHPAYASGFVLLGRCYMATEDRGKAEKALTRALQLTPHNQIARKLLFEVAPPPPVEGHVFEIDDIPERGEEIADLPSESLSSAESEGFFSGGDSSPAVDELPAEGQTPSEPFPSLDDYVQQHSTTLAAEVSLDDYLGTAAPKQEDDLGALATQLENADRITPPEPVTPMRPDEAMTFESNIVTPTLAEIYASQGEYGAAIQAYEILMLSKPEDRERFERRIQELYQLEMNRG